MTHDHVHIGPLGDERPYRLANPQQWGRSLANQMATRTAQGGTSYENKDAYDSRLWHTWDLGIGQDADTDGLLYAEVDTRVHHQITLPGLVTMTDGLNEDGAATDIRNRVGSKTGTLSIGDNGDYDRVAIYVDGSSLSVTLAKLWIYARISPNATVTVSLYAVDGDNKPTGAALATASITGDVDYHFRMYMASFSYTLNAERCIVIYPTTSSDTVELVCGGTYTNAATWTSSDDGSTWDSHATCFPFFLTDINGINSKGSVADLVRFNGNTYAAVGTQLYKYSTSNENWSAVGTARPATITDLEVYGSTLYIGQGDGAVYQTMSTGESYSAGATNGRLFHRGQKGYLWKAISNNVYWSADGSTWSSAIPVGPSTYTVRGFASSQGEIYVATDDALWVIAPSDIAQGITRFPGSSSTNGVSMTSFEGTVYLPLNGHFYQFTELAAMSNLWKSRPEELPASKLGKVILCEATGTSILVGVQPDSSTGAASVWTWNGQGWHFLASLPNGLTLTSIRYDRDLSRVWLGTSTGLIFWFYSSDYLVNPVRDGNASFMPYGWFETDWFSGPVLEDRKDFDSIFMLARSLSDGGEITVYWQDDTSGSLLYLTTEDGDALITEGGDYLVIESQDWQTLDSFTSDKNEKRWALDATARDTREIRLGFLVSTANSGLTPKIEAFRLKYHSMVTDWNMWTVPFLVSGTDSSPQEMSDGTMQSYSREEMRQHLMSCEGHVGPILYTDIGGTTYEVKVRASQEMLMADHPETKRDGTAEYDSVILMTLEQVHTGSYSG